MDKVNEANMLEPLGGLGGVARDIALAVLAARYRACMPGQISGSCEHTLSARIDDGAVT
jgi:hypothetical protein